MSSCTLKKSKGCKCFSKQYQDFRDWEKDEKLKRNFNLSKEELEERFKGKAMKDCSVSLDDIVYVYVVSTTKVEFNQSTSSYEIHQYGCGPNVEGRIITLTNCKHNMRTWETLKDLYNQSKLWIAGVTSKEKDKNTFQKYFLFYLMKVDETILGKTNHSFYDIWRVFGQVQNIRCKKNACQNPLGDLYQPRPNCNDSTKYDPNYYYPPCQDHVHYPNYMTQCSHRYRTNPNCWITCNRNKEKEGCWAEDIAYYCNSQSNHPLLLVGESPFIGKKKGKDCFNSYLWSKPMIEFHYTQFRTKRMSLRDFLSCLKAYP